MNVNVRDNCKAVKICGCQFSHFYKKKNNQPTPGFDSIINMGGYYLPFIITNSLSYKNDNKCLTLP